MRRREGFSDLGGAGQIYLCIAASLFHQLLGANRKAGELETRLLQLESPASKNE
jgi:hypothetical protein